MRSTKTTLNLLVISAGLIAAPSAFAQAPAPLSQELNERAETQSINSTINQSNQAANQQADQNNAQYNAQVAAYDTAMVDYRATVDRYRVERAAYRRNPWSTRYRDWVLDTDAGVIESRVVVLNGDALSDPVGRVTAIARAKGSNRIEAVKVRLDTGEDIWIDRDDIRFNRSDRVLITNLNRGDLVLMARRP